MLPTKSDGIPDCGPAFRSLVLRLDRPLLLISSFNKLVSGANFTRRPKSTDRFRRVPTLGSYQIPTLWIRCRILGTWVSAFDVVSCFLGMINFNLTSEVIPMIKP
jgi:hypothetical protein